MVNGPKRKKQKVVPMRSPRSPRVRNLKRREIYAVSWRMKKANPDCTHHDVRKALIKSNPIYWTTQDRRTVERWSFRHTLTAANRGTALITSALVKKILKRNADPTISDTEKTTRKMSEYFTSAGMPISNASVHAIYVNNNLYPARETYELDLRQHHHRRLRVHFARKKRRMTQEDWEAWVSSDETIIYMQKPRNARNNVKWVPKGTVRPNARATAKHVPSLLAWGAIGGHGQKSRLHLFRGTLTAAYYKETILNKFAIPFYKKIKKDFPDAVFWQDNDPKHTPNQDYVNTKFDRFTAKPPAPCRTNIQYTGKRGRPKSDPCKKCICGMPAYLYHPANSADLPPIENVWSILQNKIWEDRSTSINTLDQLEKATKKAWKSITPAEILAIQHSMPKRMKAVIESEGWPIDY
jgi:hypothetical protein